MKGKRLLSFVLVLCLIVTALPMNLVSVFAASGVSHEKGYILGVTDQEIKNEDIGFKSGNDDLDGNDVVITSDDSNVVVSDSGITASKKGLYILNVSYGIAKTEVYLIIKDKTDKEYVLYSNDFEDVSDGSLPNDFENVCGDSSRAFVKDGKLHIKASDVGGSSYLPNVGVPGSNIVVLPKFLRDFPDVIIRTNTSFEKVYNASRWMSVAYRYVSSSSFFHMSFRQNGTEVECTKYLGGSQWQKESTQPSPYAPGVIPLNKSVNVAIGVRGNSILEYMDGYNVANVQTDAISSNGHVAIIANQCDIAVDDIKVVLNEGQKVSEIEVEGQDDIPLIPNTGFSEVYMPKTAINTDPSTLAYINSREDFEIASGEKTPSSAVINMETVSGEVVAVDKNGEKIASVVEIFEFLNGKVMPAFSVKDEETALKLAKILKTNSIGDTFIISDNTDLLRKVYAEYNMMRGIVDYTSSDFSSVTDESEIMQTIMEETNKANTKIALLPESLASKENIRYLQRRFMTVFVEAENTDAASLWNMIIAGSSGIISSNWADIINMMETVAPNTRGATPIITKTPFIVGHRGLPSQCPENSISGGLAAIENGADMVEIDVYLSKDGVAFLNHDYTLDRTTNCTGNRNTATMTIDEITSYKFREVVNGNVTSTVLDEHVPTAREYFEAMKGKDVVIVCELKTSDPNIVPAMKELIEELDMKDQFVFISFYRDLIALTNAQMPWSASADLNLNGSTNDKNMASNMKNLLTITRTYNCVPDGAYNTYSLAYIRNANYRGVPIYSWTYRDENLLRSQFVNGQSGLTTDYSNWSKTYTTDVYADDERLATDETTLIMSTAENQTTAVKYRRNTKIGIKSAVTNGKLYPILDDGVIDADKGVFTKNQNTLAFIKHTHVLGSYRYDTYSNAYTVYFGDEVSSNPFVTLKGENEEVSYEIANGETSFEIEVNEDTSKVEISCDNMGEYKLYADKDCTTAIEGTVDLNKRTTVVYIKAEDTVYTLTIKRPIKQFITVKAGEQETSFEINDEITEERTLEVNVSEEISAIELAFDDVSDYQIYADPYFTVTCENNIPVNESTVKIYVKVKDSIYTVMFKKPVKQYTFTDMSEGDWFKKYVDALNPYGILKGDNIDEDAGTATIRGNEPASRNETAIFILRMLGIEANIFADEKMPFVDRDETQAWSDNYIKAAYALGFIKGEETENGLVYRGKDKITRAEFFALIARALMPLTDDEGYKEVNFDSFEDKEDIERFTWFENEFKFVIYTGIATGKDDGLKPNEDVLRCQIITAIARALNLEK